MTRLQSSTREMQPAAGVARPREGAAEASSSKREGRPPVLAPRRPSDVPLVRTSTNTPSQPIHAAPGTLPGSRVPAPTRMMIGERRGRGRGRPLENSTRQRLEGAFGERLDGIQVHDDPDAAALARSVSARAFGVGSDLFFAADRYRPGTSAGDALIAHEAVHAVQQRDVAGGGELVVSDPGATHELEAAEIAERVATDRGGRSTRGSLDSARRSGVAPAWRPRTRAPAATLHRDGPTPAPGGSIAAVLPAGTAFENLHATVTLPGKVVLKSTWKADLKTEDWGGRLDITMTQSSITIKVTGVFVENPAVARCDVDKVIIWLGTSQVSTSAHTSGSFGVDPRQNLEADVSAFVRNALAGSPIVEKFGYNPFTDPDPKGTLDQVAAKVKANLAGGDPSPLNASDVGITNVGATLKITEDIVTSQGAGSVEILAGTEIGVDTNPHATFGALGSASSIKSVAITSGGIMVKKDGAPVVRIKAVQVAAGLVKVTDLELLGEAKAAAEKERGLLTAFDALYRLGQGLPPALAMAKVALDDPRAVIVPGITRATIESALQSALNDWVAKNGTKPGGQDLSGVLAPAVPRVPAQH